MRLCLIGCKRIDPRTCVILEVASLFTLRCVAYRSMTTIPRIPLRQFQQLKEEYAGEFAFVTAIRLQGIA